MFKTIPILVAVRGEWKQFSSITCNFQSMFCRSDSEEEERWWCSRGSNNEQCRAQKNEGGKLNFDIRRQTTGVLLKCQKKLHRKIWNGLCEKPGNSRPTHQGAGAHQARAQRGRNLGLLGLVGSCFPLVVLQIYPTELEMQLPNSVYTCYSLKIFKCNLKWVFLASPVCAPLFPIYLHEKQIYINAVSSTCKSKKNDLCRPCLFFSFSYH